MYTIVYTFVSLWELKFEKNINTNAARYVL